MRYCVWPPAAIHRNHHRFVALAQAGLDVSRYNTFDEVRRVGGLPGGRRRELFITSTAVFRPWVWPEQIDAKANDLKAGRSYMVTLIDSRELDLLLVGMGMNGHIALNEPSTQRLSLSNWPAPKPSDRNTSIRNHAHTGGHNRRASLTEAGRDSDG
jgi:hypothetical protein